MSHWPYPHIVAHRGGGKLAPENTLAAIDTGARYGHTAGAWRANWRGTIC